MIEVGQVGVNSFTLTGDKLSDAGSLCTSSISIHREDEWAIKIYWDRELRRSAQVRENLKKAEVIQILKDMLNAYNDSEDINEHEISLYMGNIHATVNKHGLLKPNVKTTVKVNNKATCKCGRYINNDDIICLCGRKNMINFHGKVIEISQKSEEEILNKLSEKIKAIRQS
jgi:3-deoxy-D-arabino-heptulosonate 7-phosphate (DAHP) synthase class II